MNLKERFSEGYNKRVFVLTLVLAIIFALPILLSDRYYIDDLGRSLVGYTKWGNDGRPLSSLVMNILNFGKPLVNLSPLLQITGIALLVTVISSFMSRAFPNKNTGLIALGGFLLIANPFFIENISYKYDALPMAMSVSLLVIPYFMGKDRWNDLISTGMIFLSLSCYQASVGLFVILAITDAVISLSTSENKTKYVLGDLTKRALQLVVAYLLYKWIIINIFVNGEYAQRHSKIIGYNDIVTGVLSTNIGRTVWYWESLVKPMPVLVSGGIFLIFLASYAKVLLKAYRANGLFASIFIAVSPLLILFFSIVHIILLEDPVFSPRVFVPFGGVLLFIAINTAIAFGNKKYAWLLLMPMTYVCFFYSYTYANVSSSQEKTDTRIATSIGYDISHNNRQQSFISVYGTMPMSGERALVSSKLPLIEKLVPIYMNYDWWWAGVLLNHHGVKGDLRSLDNNALQFICKEKPFVTTSEYKLYDYAGSVIIAFEDLKCRD